MITVHHLENSRSMRVLWLLEELGVAYEIKEYKRDPVSNLAPESYRKLHRLGKAPVVSDGDVVLAETGAIVEYLLDKHDDGRLRPPKGSAERAAYHYWLHAAEGSLMPMLTVGIVLSRMNSGAPFFMKPIVGMVTGRVRKQYVGPGLAGLYDVIEEQLGRSEWFAGASVTAADVMMSYPMEAATGRAGLDARYPNAQAYMKRLNARPGYLAAVDKGGGFNLVTK